MSGLEIFGAVATVLDLVGRSINAVCTLRDLHRDLRSNPAQCDRVWASLRKLRAYLEEKACLQEMQAACLGSIWLDVMGEVRAVLLEAARDLETVAGSAAEKRAGRLVRVREFARAGRTKQMLDGVEERTVRCWERLCACDGVVRGAAQTREILGAVKAGGDELHRGVEDVVSESRRGAEDVKEKMAGMEVELMGGIDAVGKTGDEVLGAVQGCQKDIADVRDAFCALSSVLTPEILAGLARLQCNPPACFDAVRKVVSQSDEELSAERMSGIVFEALTPSSSVGDIAGGEVGDGWAEDRLDEDGRYERDRAAFMELQPKAAAFLRRLEAGKIGSRLSEGERGDVFAIFDKLWKPWEIDASGLVFDVRKRNGRQFQIGAGSYGSVFRATWDKTGGRKVKVLYQAQVTRWRENFRADFCREASLLYRLRHPSIALFYGARWPKDVYSGATASPARGVVEHGSDSDDEGEDEAEEEAFLVMELMDGDAGKLLEKCGKLTERDDIVRLLLHIAEALEYIHRENVLHLDVKPENILVRTFNGRLVGRAKLTDFGLSRQKIMSARSCSFGGSTGRGGIGTAAYMAPELLTGSYNSGDHSGDDPTKKLIGSRVSSACDVYSFGVTLCTLIHLLNNPGQKVPERFSRSEGELAVAAYTGQLCLETREWMEEVLAGDGLRDIAVACVEVLKSRRPPMAYVVKALRLLVCDSPEEEPGSSVSVRAALVGVDCSDCDELCALGQKEILKDGDTTSLMRAIAIFEQAAFSGSSAALCNLGWLREHGFGFTRNLSEAADLYERAKAWRNLALLTRHGLGTPRNERKARDLLDRESAVDKNSWSNLCYLVEDAGFIVDTEIDQAMYVSLLDRAMEAGSVSARNKLGILFQRGVGVDKNSFTAVELFRQAVAGGSMAASLNLGLCFSRGWGGLKHDDAKAFQLYQKAADSGECIDAVNCLGMMFRDGKPTRDEEKAFELLTFAGNGGSVDALVNLGMLYEQGRGVNKDETRAVALYQRAADARNVNGIYHLAACYENGLGVARDEGKAAEHYKIAADGGKVSAVLNLGILAERGRGVDKNPLRAAELYSAAAGKGCLAAMVRLGRLYETGVGLAKDEEKAVQLFRQAARGGHAGAFNSLALANWYGRGGLVRDEAKAARLFQKAIKGGHCDAETNLNRLNVAREGSGFKF